MPTTQMNEQDGIDLTRKPAPKKKRNTSEKFFWVQFQAKSDPMHKDDVELSVNGETLVLQREKKVALPQRFLECADHARYAKFKQVPGEDRKVVAHILMFPYTTIGEATRSDFLNQKMAGTKKLKNKGAE